MSVPPGDCTKDDKDIPDSACLLRRIPPYGIKGNPGRPNSSNFGNSPDGTGTSVDILEQDREPGDSLAGHDGFGLVSVTAGDLRSLGLGIIRIPLPGNPHHAHIQGPKSRSIKRKIAECAEWVVHPSQS